jgi:hypothetical protein
LSSARPSTGWEIGITEAAIADVSLPPRAKIAKLIRRLSGTLVIFFHAIAYAPMLGIQAHPEYTNNDILLSLLARHRVHHP